MALLEAGHQKEVGLCMSGDYATTEGDKTGFPGMIDGERVNAVLDVMAVLNMGTRTSLSPSRRTQVIQK